MYIIDSCLLWKREKDNKEILENIKMGKTIL